jgi:hypothetical protein
MARRNFRNTDSTTDQSTTENAVNTETTQETTVSTQTPEQIAADEQLDEALEASDQANGTAPAQDDTESGEDNEQPIDLGPFEAAVQAAMENKDGTTGVIPEAYASAVVAEFRALPGAKGKGAARRYLDAGMKRHVEAMEVLEARVYMDLQKMCTPASSSSAPRAPKEVVPVDPADAAAARLAILSLAYSHTASTFGPEVDLDSAQEKANELVEKLGDEVASYLTWLTTEGEEAPEEPSVSVVAKKAAKLASGGAASAGGATKSSGNRSTFVGKRGNIANHIQEAFANLNSGDFLTVNQIADFQSQEYTDSEGNFRRPSQGAISARLFPTGEGVSCTVEGVIPAEENGKKGAKKA